MKFGPAASALLCLSLCAACSVTSSGEGAARFTVYGEDYIEKQIPASDVEDGWTIRYTKFLVSIGEVRVGGAAGTQGFTLFDVTKPGPRPLADFRALPAKHHERVSFQISPVTAQTALADATEADKARMLQGGYSVYAEGEVSKDAVKKTFAWGFTTSTLYDRCAAPKDGKETEGVVITPNGEEEVEITIHGDHLFYDDLTASNAKVRGGNVAAADADADGAITLDELSRVKLVDLKDGPYGTGSLPDVYDLRAFVTALTRTLGHFRGEGECAVTRL